MAELLEQAALRFKAGAVPLQWGGYPYNGRRDRLPSIAFYGVISIARYQPVKAHSTDENIEEKFQKLLRKWKEETAFDASPLKKIKNKNYRDIMKLGDEAIPYILSELKKESDDWFFALEYLTGANPVSQEESRNFRLTTEAWLRWGEQNNLI